LLRGTAINGAISTNGTLPSGHGRRDALADLEWFLESAPNSGDAHYQRGYALTGLADVNQAHAAFARAIPLLPDPTDALVDHAALSCHVFDYATAAKLITLAIERRPLVPEYYEQRALYRTFLRDFRGRYLDNARAVKLHDRPNAISLAEVEAREHDPGNQPVTARQDTPAVRAALARLAGDWDAVLREPDRRTADDPTPRTLIFQFHDGDLSIVRPGGLLGVRPSWRSDRVSSFFLHPGGRTCKEGNVPQRARRCSQIGPVT
jgi:tetratricopeptide (TPR) repeat protein